MQGREAVGVVSGDDEVHMVVAPFGGVGRSRAVVVGADTKRGGDDVGDNKREEAAECVRSDAVQELRVNTCPLRPHD